MTLYERDNKFSLTFSEGNGEKIFWLDLINNRIVMVLNLTMCSQ